MRFINFITLLGAVGIVTYDELFRQHRMPDPSVYRNVVTVWAVLFIISELGAPEIAGIFGVGFVLAMFFTYVQNPDNPPVLANPRPSITT